MIEKEFISDVEKISNKHKTMFLILEALKEKPTSISDLSKRLKINRSTLRYYLKLLKNENKIIIDKRDNEVGRPTLLKINEQNFKEEWDKTLKDARENLLKTINSEYTKKIISLLEKKESTQKEILEVTKSINPDLYFSETLNILNLLSTHNFELLEMKYKLNSNWKENLNKIIQRLSNNLSNSQ